jgi:3-dehydroquinate synthase
VLDAGSKHRIITLLEAAGLPTTMPDIASDAMLSHMGRDKKNEGGAIRLILLKNVGTSYVEATVSSSRIRAFLDANRPKTKHPMS